MKKISIRIVSIGIIVVTVVIGAWLGFISTVCARQFQNLQDETERFIQCESAVQQMQAGSDYLEKQVREYVQSGQYIHMDFYLREIQQTQRYEEACSYLKTEFGGTTTISPLEAAIEYEARLREQDYYIMRLMVEVSFANETLWPDEIRDIELTPEDEALDLDDKWERAQEILDSHEYKILRTNEDNYISSTTQLLGQQTRNNQNHAQAVFRDVYAKFEMGVALLMLLVLLTCMAIWNLVVAPLKMYSRSIVRGEIFPVVGAKELQELANTYNKVYKENQEAQKLIRHEAEHDALTDALNRGAFEKILDIYEKGGSDFAMIMVDVDTFKQINDHHGHAVGDRILVKVANNLTREFRSIDYICRIGGDEFAIIMVDVGTEHTEVVREKIAHVNELLFNPTDGLPPVSLSVGVAFADRENPGQSIYKDADKALYKVKNSGRHNCGFYEG